MFADRPDPGRLQKTESALARWRGGDRGALDEICSRYQAGLEIFLRLHHRRLAPLLRQRIEVADVVQETWVRACTKLHLFEYRGLDSFRRWIWNIALNVFHDQRTYWRAEQRDPSRVAEPGHDSASSNKPLHRVVSPGHGPASNASLSEEVEQSLAILERLPRRQRLIVLLAEFYDESWQEIARAVHAKSGEAVRKEYQLKVLPTIQRLRTSFTAAQPPSSS
jgi:RNA polymerase sigma factor (sigma-70 family)